MRGSGHSYRNEKRKIFLSNRMIYHIYENAGKQLMKNCRRTDLLKAKKCLLEAIKYRKEEQLRVNVKNTTNKGRKNKKIKKQ